MHYNISFKNLERELKKRIVIPYNWKGKKQNNNDDKRSNFIYKSPFFEYIQKKIKTENLNFLSDYILNRWYNYWSAKAVESIFVQHKNITAESDVHNKYSDFSIYDENLKKHVKFDHKTTVLPKCFEQEVLDNLENLQIFNKKIIEWLYKNQSQEGRKHWENRFFVILIDSKNKQHWKLKSELVFLHNKISLYLKKFSITDCVTFFYNDKEIYCSVCWIVK